ncbi:leucine-rich repeat domain-containing protein [Tessaracoccus lubricantis]
MRSLSKLLLAAVLAVTPAHALPAGQARADIDVYTTEGTHVVNGRQWRTACEPYSQTTRCRTEIKATVITYEQLGDATKRTFTRKTDWAFNNLTYLPASRKLWGSNPLANPGHWTAADGRQWRTECDNERTGRRGCRSYALATVVTQTEAERAAGVYGWQDQWVFNNIVRFTDDRPAVEVPIGRPSVAPSPEPTEPGDEVSFADHSLTECVRARTGHDRILRSEVEALTTLKCVTGNGYTVRDLEGIQAATNLAELDIQGRRYTAGALSLKPLASLSELTSINLYQVPLADLSDLNALTGLEHLLIGGPDAPVTGLRASHVAELDLLETFMAMNAGLSDASFVAELPLLKGINLDDNQVTDVSPFAALENLTFLSLRNNPVGDWSPLDQKVAEGLQLVR